MKKNPYLCSVKKIKRQLNKKGEKTMKAITIENGKQTHGYMMNKEGITLMVVLPEGISVTFDEINREAVRHGCDMVDFTSIKKDGTSKNSKFKVIYA